MQMSSSLAEESCAQRRSSGLMNSGPPRPRKDDSMALPPVRIQNNVKLIGHSDLGGAPNAGEGMAMKVTPNGQRLLYLAHENPPMAMSILDVTDPARPELVYQAEVPHNDVRGNSLAIHGDTLLLAS